MVFWVYEHWRPDKNQPFYVGKGRLDRANNCSVNRGNPYYNNVIRVVLSKNLKVEVKLVRAFTDPQDAYQAEIRRIAFWKKQGVRLTNMTDGGEGMLNPTEELRTNLSNLLRGRIRTDSWRENISKGVLAVDPEIRQKQYAAVKVALTGIVRSDETCARVSAAKKNPPIETRQRNAEAARRSWRDPVWRANQIAKRTGRIQITNGINNRAINPTEPIPAGWWRGFTKRKRAA